MILVVESGSTKTDWCLADRNTGIEVFRNRTEGLNPAVMPMDVFRSRLASAASSLAAYGAVDRVYYYGAGVISGHLSEELEGHFQSVFPEIPICLGSDLEAASKALFADSDGIASILGTGSNSCQWEGGAITRHVNPGGFVLGDEGGAASLGRMLMSDFIKGLLPKDIESELTDIYNLDYAAVVANVYRNPAAAAWLAGFARFVHDHRKEEYCAELISRNLSSFIERVLLRYDVDRLPVGVVGSLGKACRDTLETMGNARGICFSAFIQSPVGKLVRYHLDHA